MAKPPKLFIVLNQLDAWGILLILAMALVFQFAFEEIPCPLCLLQRFGLLAMTFGLLLNLLYGIRPAHYAMSLLAAVFTGVVSMRQVLLHIAPVASCHKAACLGYGLPFLGLHLYTWVFLLSVMFIVWIAFHLLLQPNFKPYQVAKTGWIAYFRRGILFTTLFVIGINIVMVFEECGVSLCPENPTHYQYNLFP